MASIMGIAIASKEKGRTFDFVIKSAPWPLGTMESNSSFTRESPQ
jgi:hypothetical protein